MAAENIECTHSNAIIIVQVFKETFKCKIESIILCVYIGFNLGTLDCVRHPNAKKINDLIIIYCFINVFIPLLLLIKSSDAVHDHRIIIIPNGSSRYPCRCSGYMMREQNQSCFDV